MALQLSRRVTLRQLEVFAVAARELNFARVAEQLHLSQPAVSMQIRQLEDAVGLPLFEKVGRRKMLTEAGLMLQNHASRLLGELQDAEQGLQSLMGLSGGSVSLGLVSTAKYFAPRLLAAFARSYPRIDVHFVEGNREMLVHMLRENRLDLALMGRPPAELDAVSVPLATNYHVLAAPVRHPLAAQRNVDLHALRDDTFLLREPGSGTRQVMEELFRSHLFKPQRLVTLSGNETVKQAVMAGLGLSVLSLHTMMLELRAREIVALDLMDMPMLRTWHLVQLRQRRLSPSAVACRSFLIERAQSALRAAELRLPGLRLRHTEPANES